MKTLCRQWLMLLLCIIIVPSLTIAQENYVEYGDLWIINHSSYRIRVLVDGWEQGSVLSGASLRITVSVGYHEIYAEEYHSGEIQWMPGSDYVTAEGYDLTFYDPEPEEIDQQDHITQISNLYVINTSAYDARVFVDGWEKGTVVAGGTFTTTIQGGFDYELYAENLNGEITWGPDAIYLPKGEDFTWTIEY